MNPPYEIVRGRGRLVATAIHAGTELRPQVDELLVMPRIDKLREEDPYTDGLVGVGDTTIVVNRSRFEVDLNRPRDRSVYRTSEDAWGLHLWDEDLPPDVVAGSLAIYDQFYADLAYLFGDLAREGPFIVFDIHSYNHRRNGALSDPEPYSENPEINLGTGSLDCDRWAPVVDAFVDSMSSQTISGQTPDIRENVKFKGGNFSGWAHSNFGEHACVLAIELKKVFMDEWSGEPFDAHLADLRSALHAVKGPVLDALSEVRKA